MAVGIGKGDNRAEMAAKAAISSPLLEVTIEGARGVLFNITGGEDLSLFEVNEAAEIIRGLTDPNANIIFGAVIDPSLQDEMRITVIATGFDHQGGQPRRATPAATVITPSRPASTQQSAPPPAYTSAAPTQAPAQQQPARPQPTNTTPPAPQSGQRDFAPKQFDREDLDIPAFLRRNNK